MGIFADWIKIKGFLTVTQIRKYFTCVGMTIQGLLMIATAYSTDPKICIILLTCAVGTGASAYPGKLKKLHSWEI